MRYCATVVIHSVVITNLIMYNIQDDCAAFSFSAVCSVWQILCKFHIVRSVCCHHAKSKKTTLKYNAEFIFDYILT